MKLSLGLLLAGGGLLALPNAHAQSLTQVLGAPITRALDGPVFVTSWPGNPDLLLVVERATAKITVWDIGSSSPTESLFVSLASTAWVPAGTSDFLGVTALAFHPRFLTDPTKRLVYVRYNENLANAPTTRVVGYTVAPGKTSVQSNTPVLQIYDAPTTATGHGSGTLHFDNRYSNPARLWVPVPDNADTNIDIMATCEVAANVQDWNGPTDFGKLLSVNVDLVPPAVSLHATGLRNPFGFCVDPGVSGSGLGRGDVWMGDTGWNDTGSVIRYTPSGAYRNYGWPWKSGNGQVSWMIGPVPTLTTECGDPTTYSPMEFNEPTPAPTYTDPYRVFSDVSEFTAGHDAIIGGYVYRESEVTALQNRYVFATYGQQVSGPRIYSLPAENSGTAAALNHTTSLGVNTWAGSYIHALGQGVKGNIYIVRVDASSGGASTGPGRIYRIDP